MIFTSIITALAALASVSAVEQRCAPKGCKGINCLETLARINFEPKWCGAELMEKLARRAILRPDINWNYNPTYDLPTNSPCANMQLQDPSLGVAVINSYGQILCSTPDMQTNFPGPTTATNDPVTVTVTSASYTTTIAAATVTAFSYDYSYPVHASEATNHVKYVNYNGRTYVAVPLYFRDGTVETVVFAKDNADLPIVCCENPSPVLTQCRRFY